MRGKSFYKAFGLWAVLAAALMASGCDREKSPPPAGQAASALPEVGVITLAAAPVTLTTELSGRTAPLLIAEVRPQVDGLILKRFFVEGSDVNADSPLYQIDPAVYQFRANSAKAALEKARANLETARPRAERHKRMLSSQAIGQQDYDDALAAWKQAEADVSMAEAELENARIQLERTKVLAPISGRIGRSNVTQGALVTANQFNPLAVIQRLDPIYVDVTRSSAELLRLKSEMASGDLLQAGENAATVRLILEDGSLYPHEGRLQFSDVTVNPSTGTITLRAIFPNPEHALLPGMYVRTRLETARHEKAILVPQQALFREASGQAYVLALKPDNSVERREVSTLRAMGGSWIIRHGLEAGERVIVEGSQRVRFIPDAPAPVAEPKEMALPGAGGPAVNSTRPAPAGK